MKILQTPILLLFLCFSFYNLLAGNGYEIKVKIDGFKQDELYLAYHYGHKTYIKDTTQIKQNDHFIFSGDEALPGGVYMIVVPPNNHNFEILIDKNEQHFSLSTNIDDLTGSIQFQGNASDNQLFYEYLNFLSEHRPLADELNNKKENLKDQESEIKKIDAELEALNVKVQSYQNDLISKHPTSLSAAIIKSNMPVDLPEFKGSKEDIDYQKWRYMQKHYFDNINLSDSRLLRTPFLFSRIDTYVQKLQVQHPDTLAIAIDQILKTLEPAEESFKFYLIHFLNQYAQSKMVGMDAVYVHLVKNYYANGKAPWTEATQLNKILENAKTLEPLLIGKTAPDFKATKPDNSTINLHDINSEFTVLYFWRYDCGNCKKQSAELKTFYEQYKNKGVTILAICNKYTDEVEGCWKYMEEKELGDWIHTADPYNKAKISTIYNIKSTPQIYLLDKQKKILSKQISAFQLAEVLDRFLK